MWLIRHLCGSFVADFRCGSLLHLAEAGPDPVGGWYLAAESDGSDWWDQDEPVEEPEPEPDTWARLARGEKRVRTKRDFVGAGQVNPMCDQPKIVHRPARGDGWGQRNLRLEEREETKGGCVWSHGHSDETAQRAGNPHLILTPSSPHPHLMPFLTYSSPHPLTLFT